MLYKLFDSQDICQRRDNMDLLLALDLVHEIEYLSLDNRFCLLSRPFIEGSHHPSNLSDFIGACYLPEASAGAGVCSCRYTIEQYCIYTRR